MSMDIQRFKVLRAFGVAPWSEEAKGLTEEMVAEYYALLDGAEESTSSAFDEKAFISASIEEGYSVMPFTEDIGRKVSKNADFDAFSDYLDRELRRRDKGFTSY